MNGYLVNGSVVLVDQVAAGNSVDQHLPCSKKEEKGEGRGGCVCVLYRPDDHNRTGILDDKRGGADTMKKDLPHHQLKNVHLETNGSIKELLEDNSRFNLDISRKVSIQLTLTLHFSTVRRMYYSTYCQSSKLQNNNFSVSDYYIKYSNKILSSRYGLWNDMMCRMKSGTMSEKAKGNPTLHPLPVHWRKDARHKVMVMTMMWHSLLENSTKETLSPHRHYRYT